MHITVVCGYCGRVVVVSNHWIVPSNHSKLLAGAVRAHPYSSKGSKSSKGNKKAQKTVKAQKLLVQAKVARDRSILKKFLKSPKFAKKLPSIIGKGLPPCKQAEPWKFRYGSEFVRCCSNWVQACCIRQSLIMLNNKVVLFDQRMHKILDKQPYILYYTENLFPRVQMFLKIGTFNLFV